MSEYDTVVREGYVQDRDQVVDIGISDGEIRTVEPDIDGTGMRTLDAAGNLVAPSFTDCHLHADRSFSLCGGRHPQGNDYKPDTVGLRETYTHEQFDEHFGDLTVEALTEHIIQDVQRTVAAGTGYVRTHLSLDHVPETKLMEATLAAKAALDDIADVQLVPYVASSLIEDDDARALLCESIELAQDRVGEGELLLGGIGTGATEGKDIDRTIDEWFALATEYGLDLDVHVQDHGSLGGYTLERLLQATMAGEFEGRVTASHCYTLADLPVAWREKLIDLAAKADVQMVTCYSSTPCTWPLRDLLDAGIPVGHGTDNTHDYIMPYGISDSIEGALIESVKLTRFEDYPEDIYWYQSNEGLQALWDLITHSGAAVLGIEDYGLAPGTPADLVVLDEPSQEWAITREATRRYVLKDGRVVAEDDQLLPEYDALA